MVPETIKGKPERVSPIPAAPFQHPASDEALESQANRAVDELTKSATGARHQLGKGIPANHPALG